MGFYNRSIYVHKRNGFDVPDCFVQLEGRLNTLSLPQRFTTGTETLAENVCRRMADVDLFRTLIAESLRDRNPFVAAVQVTSFQVAYFGACKSFLDSLTVTLSELYSLPLTNKQQDVNNRAFWTALRSAESNLHDKLATYRPLFAEVVDRRDASVHRISPQVTVVGSGPPGDVPADQLHVKMVPEPGVRIEELMMRINLHNEIPDWIEPLTLMDRWRPTFIRLCEEICTVLAGHAETLAENQNRSQATG